MALEVGDKEWERRLELSDEDWFNFELGFNRGVLRRSPQFIEKDFKDINPRELMRKIRRRIQDISRLGRFKFEIMKDPLEVRKEKVGQYSGFVRGGLFAVHKRTDHKGGRISYNPYGLYGGFALIFGVLLLFTSFAQLARPNTYLAVLGAILLCLGAYFAFLYRESEKFPIDIASKLRALILGEVWEKALEEKGSRERKIKGSISTVFSGETNIELRSLDNYRSILRGKVKNVNALVSEIGKLEAEILQELYLENRENMKEPLDPREAMRMSWSLLSEKLRYEFGREQINSWMSRKLVDKGVVEQASVAGLQEDLRIAKEEVEKIAKGIEDYVERE